MTAPIGESLGTVVYVEDEPAMIDLITLILSRHGFEVAGALSGAEGLQLIRKTRPDLILLDLMMPDMSGWDVYHALRADDELSHIPVIVVTARAATIDRTLGLRIAKVQDYITKPFSPAELVRRIGVVLGDSRLVTAADDEAEAGAG